MKSRNWLITINYFEESDIQELITLIDLATYSIYCIEGHNCPDHHYHIHAYLHFKNDRHDSAIINHFTRHPHLDAVKDVSSTVSYIQGMKDGKLKCPTCELMWFETGIIPSNGKNTSTELVISDIKAGYTYNQILEKYPSYCMFHANKVKEFINSLTQKKTTKFYVISPNGDPITSIHYEFDDLGKLAVVTDLAKLEVYDDYDTVLYLSDFYDSEHMLWPRGMPITYKYGFTYKKVICDRFIITSNEPTRYSPYYKKI